MKKALLVILVLAACAGCNKTPDNTALKVKFSHTGCARTKADEGSATDTPSLITLKYVDGALEFIHTGAMLNCSVTWDGAECNAVVSGNVLSVTVEALGDPLRCMCPVDRIAAEISGLTLGEQYTLNYNCSGPHAPVSFVFNEDLLLILDESDLLTYYSE